MILSFSIPEMRPMIEAGIRQARGEDVTGRVKRQTIRRLKPESQWHLLIADPGKYPLDLWWRSPRVGGQSMGVLPCRSADKICIAHSRLTNECIRTDKIVSVTDLNCLAYADGFDTLDAFCRFFVPKPGDVFDGVLIKW